MTNMTYTQTQMKVAEQKQVQNLTKIETMLAQQEQRIEELLLKSKIETEKRMSKKED